MSCSDKWITERPEFARSYRNSINGDCPKGFRNVSIDSENYDTECCEPNIEELPVDIGRSILKYFTPNIAAVSRSFSQISKISDVKRSQVLNLLHTKGIYVKNVKSYSLDDSGQYFIYLDKNERLLLLNLETLITTESTIKGKVLEFMWMTYTKTCVIYTENGKNRELWVWNFPSEPKLISKIKNKKMILSFALPGRIVMELEVENNLAKYGGEYLIDDDVKYEFRGELEGMMINSLSLDGETVLFQNSEHEYFVLNGEVVTQIDDYIDPINMEPHVDTSSRIWADMDEIEEPEDDEIPFDIFHTNLSRHTSNGKFHWHSDENRSILLQVDEEEPYIIDNKAYEFLINDDGYYVIQKDDTWYFGMFKSPKRYITLISPTCDVEEFNKKTIVARENGRTSYSNQINTYFICKLDIADF
jgi:hypothetical protein